MASARTGRGTTESLLSAVAPSTVKQEACITAGISEEEADTTGGTAAPPVQVGAKLASRALTRIAHALEQQGDGIAAAWAAVQAVGVHRAPAAVRSKATVDAVRLLNAVRQSRMGGADSETAVTR